jgi:endonuclease/exonuclease/phosphatase family metal-dependent hydrolase
MSRFIAILTLLWSASGTRADDPPADALVRVMSFNIRYGTARDGENRWDNRKEFLVETIRAFDPDLLGTQETLKFQRDDLKELLPDYAVIGVGRNDGRDDGEMMALYYRHDRFEELEQGHFWLSETPEEAGSRSWDSSLPRMVTWVRLRDRQRPEWPPLTFFNTHFDHVGTTARLESARLLRTRIEAAAGTGPVIVTGDFNCGEGSPPYRALFGSTDANRTTFIDAFRSRHPESLGDEGTFSGFRADQTAGPRIDWIGVSLDWIVQESAIDRTSREGRTPSDHWPVTATLTRPR